jgi:hypothetical protein
LTVRVSSLHCPRTSPIPFGPPPWVHIQTARQASLFQTHIFAIHLWLSIVMSYIIAAEVGQSYNFPQQDQDDESADTLGTSSENRISQLNSSHKHPKPKSQRSRHHHGSRSDTLGDRALINAPLSDGVQEQSSGWGSRLGKPKGYAPLDEIDLTDIATASSSIYPTAQAVEPDPDRHSHPPDHTHSHSHSDDHHHPHGEPHDHDHSHEHGRSHEHHHGTHSHTNHELQSLLPDGATRYMIAMSRSIKKGVVSAFQPPEDPCGSETSLACLLWDCALTVAESKEGGDHDHGAHDHDHHVHTEQYRFHPPSVPPLPSMDDWANRCPAPCLNDDGTVCTEDYHGDATRGHSHM